MYSLQHQYNNSGDQVTSRNSSSRTGYKVIPTLSLPKGKENNQQATEKNKVLSYQDEGIIKRQEGDMSVPSARTIILREWII